MHICTHKLSHTYMPFTATHIPHMMDQSPIPRAPNLPGNPNGTCTMDITVVMPPCIQSSRSAFQHQTPPHLPSLPSSCPLPSIPSTTRVEPHIPSFSLNNNQHRPIYNTNNKQHHPIYDTNPPLTSHNNEKCPLYETAFSLVSELSPICLSSISSLFNSIQAIPVKTANSGVLETPAKGNVKV